MQRRRFLQAASATALRGAAERKPNILLVLVDQWRAQTLPSAGDTGIDAPNLGRLAREGVHFERAYTANPSTAPAHASILTGLWPEAASVPRNGGRLPAETPTIATQLRQAGYKTCFIGRWHLDGTATGGVIPPGPRRHGFDSWASFERNSSWETPVYWTDSPDAIREDGFEPSRQTGLAIDFIRKNGSAPFFLLLHWGPPHPPRIPPKHSRPYVPDLFKLPPNVPAEYAGVARNGMAGYYGLCSALDRELGRLLSFLDQETLTANTFVIFTSGQGDMLGAHSLEYADVHYEESVRVPLLMRYPGKLRPASTSSLLISNADLMPTFLSACGAAIPPMVQGTDLSSQIFEGSGDEPGSIYSCGKIGTPDEWRMVVRGLDKAVFDSKNRVIHLYNLGQDQFEQLDRAEETANKRVRDELRAHLQMWKAKTVFRSDPSGLKLRP